MTPNAGTGLLIEYRPKGFIRGLARADHIRRDESLRLMKKLQYIGASAASKAAPADRRRLRDSLFVGRANSASLVRESEAIVGSKLVYAGAQEDAAKWTKRKRWFPPIAALETWVVRKRIASKEEARSVAFLVARSIARKGIKPKHYMVAAKGKVTAEAPKQFRVMTENIAKRIAKGG